MEAAIQGKDRVVECLIRNGALVRTLVDRDPSTPPRTTPKQCGAPSHPAPLRRRAHSQRRARPTRTRRRRGRRVRQRPSRRRRAALDDDGAPPAPPRVDRPESLWPACATRLDHDRARSECGARAARPHREPFLRRVRPRPRAAARAGAVESSRLTQHVTAPEQVDEMRAAVLHGARDGDHGTRVVGAAGRGADVNYQDERGRTPLHWAVERGDEEHFDARRATPTPPSTSPTTAAARRSTDAARSSETSTRRSSADCSTPPASSAR